MIVYQTNDLGIFVGEVMADENPLEAGSWLIPGGCVEIVPPEIPDGFVAVFADGAWSLAILPPQGEDGTPPEPRPLDSSDVNAERDRRVYSTFIFEGTVYDCDESSLARITGAAALAGFAMFGGALPGNFQWHGGATDFSWICHNNTVTPMDAQTCFAFGQAAAANQSAHIFAARALKELNPIPVNFADDIWWP